MEAPPEPEEVYREISPKTGRAIIYIFKFSNIRHPAGPIRKYIEIPSGSPEPPFIRVSLPSIYANRMWRRQNKLSKHKRELKDDIEKAAAEEEAALVLLHSSQDVYLSSDEEDGGTDIEETRDSNEVLRDPRTYDAELLSSKSVNSSIGDPLSGSDKEMDRRAVQKIMTASPQNENIFVQDEEAQPQVPVVLENQKGLVERQVLTNKQSSLETPIDHWNGETLLDDLSQPEESPFAFMLPVSDDPSAIQSTIAKHVLRIGGETARIYQHELVGFSHMFPGTKVLRDFFAYLPLHMDTLLGPEVDKSVEKQWYGIKTIYGDKIQQLSVSVRVAQMVQYARPKDMLRMISDMPGVHAGSEVLVPEIQRGRVNSLTTQSIPVIAHRLATKSPDIKYVGTFASTNHANIFGWLRFANIKVDQITIRILGADLWTPHLFSPSLAGYVTLPVVALIASVIAASPARAFKVSQLNLVGLGSLKNVFKMMWDGIPNRTPIVDNNPLLDLLVKYPFAEEMGTVDTVVLSNDGELKTEKREGNLFGLRTSMEWQAKIMTARHGKHSPEWKFHVTGWGT